MRRIFSLDWWPFGSATVVITGNEYHLPRWLLRTLRTRHSDGNYIAESLRQLDHWMDQASLAIEELLLEATLLMEMPLKQIRDDARVKLESCVALEKRGKVCSAMLADHIDDIDAQVEFGFGRRKHRTGTADSESVTKDTLRAVRAELASLLQDAEVRQHELSSAVARVSRLL